MGKTYEEIKKECGDLLTETGDLKGFLLSKEAEREALINEVEKLNGKKKKLKAEIEELEAHANTHFEKREENFNSVCDGEVKRLNEIEDGITVKSKDIAQTEARVNTLENTLSGKIAELDEVLAEHKKKMIDLDSAQKKAEQTQGEVDQASFKLTDAQNKVVADQKEIKKRQDDLASGELALIASNNALVQKMNKTDALIKDVGEKTAILKEGVDKLEKATANLDKAEAQLKKDQEKVKIDLKNNQDKAINLNAFEQQLALKEEALKKKVKKDA